MLPGWALTLLLNNNGIDHNKSARDDQRFCLTAKKVAQLC